MPPLKFVPSVGVIVQYKLSKDDAEAINVRRADYRAFQAGHRHPHEPGQPGATGHIAHVGNEVAEGDVFPAMVVRTWQEVGYDGVNLQVHLDGSDLYWATSRHQGEEPGQWAWPSFTPAEVAGTTDPEGGTA